MALIALGQEKLLAKPIFGRIALPEYLGTPISYFLRETP
jgi:hypothetical protein